MHVSRLSISQNLMHTLMTRPAQTHQICFTVIPAAWQGYDVMHFLDLNQPSFLEAPLAERMRCGVPLTDLTPSCSVAFTMIVPSYVSVVVPSLLLLLSGMSLAVPSVRKVRTAVESTWTFWFSWHLILHNTCVYWMLFQHLILNLMMLILSVAHFYNLFCPLTAVCFYYFNTLFLFCWWYPAQNLCFLFQFLFELTGILLFSSFNSYFYLMVAFIHHVLLFILLLTLHLHLFFQHLILKIILITILF